MWSIQSYVEFGYQLSICSGTKEYHGKPWSSWQCYRESFTFLYVDVVRTSQEAQASTACYRDNFTFIYVDDVRTSQEAEASTACYRDNFTFIYVDDVRTSQETHLWVSTACYSEGKKIPTLLGPLERANLSHCTICFWRLWRERSMWQWETLQWEQNLSLVLGVPRHCPFVLLVGVSI
jgi:hypothetical protein